MSLPFYVSPEQFLQDRADYARAGIARGRSVVVLTYADGILFATHNPSRALHKISEIYDRIGFAAVGKYHEFESLRVAGIRYADLRGFAYDRSDVSVRALANSYAQTLGAVFTSENKPYEVELVVAEVADVQGNDQLYRLDFDGTLAQESETVVIGGDASRRGEDLANRWRPGLTLDEALGLARDVLSEAGADLEAAVLERTERRRAFRRLRFAGDELS